MFLELRSSDIVQIFSIPRGEGQLSINKKLQNLTREFRDNRGQITPRSKISTLMSFLNVGRSPPLQVLDFA